MKDFCPEVSFCLCFSRREKSGTCGWRGCSPPEPLSDVCASHTPQPWAAAGVGEA